MTKLYRIRGFLYEPKVLITGVLLAVVMAFIGDETNIVWIEIFALAILCVFLLNSLPEFIGWVLYGDDLK